MKALFSVQSMKRISRSLSSIVSCANDAQDCSTYPTFMHSCLLFSTTADTHNTSYFLAHIFSMSTSYFHPAVIVSSLLLPRKYCPRHAIVPYLLSTPF